MKKTTRTTKTIRKIRTKRTKKTANQNQGLPEAMASLDIFHYLFSTATPMFRYSANRHHTRYGTKSSPAVLFSL